MKIDPLQKIDDQKIFSMENDPQILSSTLAEERSSHYAGEESNGHSKETFPKRDVSVTQCFVSHSSIEMNERNVSSRFGKRRNEETWIRISPFINVCSVQPLCLTMNRSNRKTNLI
jgi:hypothetical protein